MYTLSLKANVPTGNIVWPNPFARAYNPGNTVSGSSTFDLRGVAPFNKGDFGFPGTTDTVLLDANSSGVFSAGLGNDKFDYGSSPGTKNTLLRGGAGEDTFAVSGLNAADALKALKDNGYSFVMDDNGFSLRTKDGQEIRVRDVEKIAFKDASFDLLNSGDLNKLVKALKDAGIPIVDRVNRRPAYPPFGGRYLTNSYGLNNFKGRTISAKIIIEPSSSEEGYSLLDDPYAITRPQDFFGDTYGLNFNNYGSGLQSQSFNRYDLSDSTNSLYFGDSYSLPITINQNNYGSQGYNQASVSFA